jgi:osmotically-inducible protein OsmY
METMKTSEMLQRDVVDELAYDPKVDSSDIAVTVEDGVATLAGHMSTYGEKLAAEEAAYRVAGVKGVVDKIEVRLRKPEHDDDAILASNAIAVLRWRANVPADRIKVVVQNGWLKLEGEVKWYFQKRAAEDAVRHLYGLKGLMNHIKVTPAVSTGVIKDQIVAAFRRSAEIDANQITILAEGGHVTLRGTVRSWLERRSAESTAWSAPGVTTVTNELVVETPVTAW